MDWLTDTLCLNHALTIHGVLQAWETCAVAVLRREQLLEQLNSMQCGVADRTVPYVLVQQVEQQCIELLQVTTLLQSLAPALMQKYGLQLTLLGEPYPGEQVVGPPEMVQLMEWLSEHEGAVHFVYA